MNKIEKCNNRIWTKSTSAWSWFASYSFGTHFFRADLQKRCNFWTFAKSLLILSFLFGKQFWASLHLLSESGWNWCPWQALVSFRFPIPCIVNSCLCLSWVKLGDYFSPGLYYLGLREVSLTLLLEFELNIVFSSSNHVFDLLAMSSWNL